MSSDVDLESLARDERCNCFTYVYVIIYIFISTGVMVSMLTSSVVDCGFELRSGQTKDYKNGICCFSA